jgi:hypothetical protein
MKTLYSIICLSMMMMIGCASNSDIVNYFREDDSSQKFEVLTSDVVERPFSVVSTIEIERRFEWHQEKEAIQALRDKAKALFGDAIYCTYRGLKRVIGPTPSPPPQSNRPFPDPAPPPPLSHYDEPSRNSVGLKPTPSCTSIPDKWVAFVISWEKVLNDAKTRKHYIIRYPVRIVEPGNLPYNIIRIYSDSVSHPTLPDYVCSEGISTADYFKSVAYKLGGDAVAYEHCKRFHPISQDLNPNPKPLRYYHFWKVETYFTIKDR